VLAARRSTDQLASMYACSHCGTRCYSLLRRFWSASGPIKCPHCGEESRFAFKARIAAVPGFEILGFLFLALIFAPRFWAQLSLGIILAIGYIAVIDVFVQLVPMEQFGSAADTRNAALRFLVGTVFFILVVTAVVVAR
jgi:DNA-directed RNA polymerase subunit RPC12/RpoP